MGRFWRFLLPYVLLAMIGGPIAIGIRTYFQDAERVGGWRDKGSVPTLVEEEIGKETNELEQHVREHAAQGADGNCEDRKGNDAAGGREIAQAP